MYLFPRKKGRKGRNVLQPCLSSKSNQPTNIFKTGFVHFNSRATFRHIDVTVTVVAVKWTPFVRLVSYAAVAPHKPRRYRDGMRPSTTGRGAARRGAAGGINRELSLLSSVAGDATTERPNEVAAAGRGRPRSPRARAVSFICQIIEIK